MSKDTVADSRQTLLRELGARAHQLRATTRAADHFVAQGGEEDSDTGSWLMSAARSLAADIVSDIDSLARNLREAPADAGFAQTVQKLRVTAHELQAAARAADHFLDGDTRDDQETGGWLIACARTLAEKLSEGLDDAVPGSRGRPGTELVVDAQEAALQRRMASAASRVVGA